jgi:N-methylhydantoinase A/oxoprolinase/acetone carboxylase beta subunit
MQYVGQGHVIEVELPAAGDDSELAARLRERFEADYADLYGYSYSTAEPQIVSVTVVGSVPADAFELPLNDTSGEPGEPERRPVYFPESSGYVECEVRRRDELPPGWEVEGPAVIEDGQCAVLLLPGDVATIDEHRNVLARIGRAGDAEAGVAAAAGQNAVGGRG